MRPWVGLSLMPEPEFLAAAYPLFEAGLVDVLEWSFDVGWPPAAVPTWASSLIDHFSGADRLLGHGVSYSPLSANDHERQDAWLESLRDEVASRSYRHISEHFGFAAGGNFHQAAPLPVPLSAAALEVGRARLLRLADVAGVPIGLENLAFAFSLRDVLEQGRFIDQLLAPVHGFLVLDLHNLYCQMCNFGVKCDDLLAGYPLEKVRELHVSGGSWSDPGAAPVRRDTHDDDVPGEVFAMLPRALEACPHVEAVILERLGYTLNEENAAAFRRDFERLREMVHG
ncbi:MAG: DUF692 family protein [Gemmataceae bacterium]